MTESRHDLSDFLPEHPNADGIPPGLKAQPFWCCWEYHIENEYINRRRVEGTGPWNFNVAYSATIADPKLGIGYILDNSGLIAIEIIADEHDSAYQTIANWKTYVEHNDSINGITAIVEASILESKSSQNIRISNTGFIPITGMSICYLEPSAMQRQTNHLINSLFIPTWMDGFPENPNESELYERLKSCLYEDEWFQYPIETRLYEFFSYCWEYPQLKLEILKKIRAGYWRRQEIDALISAVETEKEKRRGKERIKESLGNEDEDIGKDRDEIEAMVQSSGRPTIIHDPTDITKSVDEVLSALVKHGVDLWQRDGLVVSIQRSLNSRLYGAEKEGGRIRINLVGIMYIVELATQAAIHYVPYKYNKNKQFYKPGSCPKAIAEHILARMSLPLRPLSSVVTVPTIRHDGSIISDPGYDEETGIYYDPMGVEFPSVPEQPNQDDIKASLSAIRDVFKDFWFAQPHDEAATLAGILTIMTRHLYKNAPLIAISASTQGIGKTLLGQCMAIIATGENHPTPPYPKNEDEMEKKMLGLAISGKKIIFWDNIDVMFGNSTLDAALTNNYSSGRILGRTNDTDIRMQACYIITGNMLRIKADAARRAMPITLDAKTQNPEERDDIEQENLDQWCLENYPHLYTSCLTLLRAFILAGKPDQGLRYGSFEKWNDLVRSCVHWLGLPDPCIGRRALQTDSDVGFDNLYNLLSSWHMAFPDGHPLKLKDIVDKVKNEDKYARSEQYYTPKEGLIELGEALLAYDIKANGHVRDISVTRLSHRLPINGGKSRIIDGLQLRSIQDKSKRTKSFWVDRIGGEEEASMSEYDDNGLVYNMDDDKKSDVPF